MKPTGAPKKLKRICPEYLVTVSANNRDEAAVKARAAAKDDGFAWYAITRIKAV